MVYYIVSGLFLTFFWCPTFFFFFTLTYSRWTSSLPSCLWSLRIFPSLPGSRLTIFYRDASSALLQLVNQWLNFTYSRSHAFRYERKNTNPTLVRIELTTSALTSRCAGYLLDHSLHGDYCKCTVQRWASPQHYTVDPMLFPSGNPFKCHEEVLYLQPLIPPKRFDIFSPLTGACSEGLGAF